MRAWLQAQACTIIALERTGVYEKPLCNLLEENLTVLLVHPAPITQGPGRKTAVKDCRWIAALVEHGLLRSSVIPPMEMRDLRDRTCYRRQFVNTRHTDSLFHRITCDPVAPFLPRRGVRLPTTPCPRPGGQGSIMGA